jgi:hypothetical protein
MPNAIAASIAAAKIVVITVAKVPTVGTDLTLQVGVMHITKVTRVEEANGQF